MRGITIDSPQDIGLLPGTEVSKVWERLVGRASLRTDADAASDAVRATLDSVFGSGYFTYKVLMPERSLWWAVWNIDTGVA